MIRFYAVYEGLTPKETLIEIGLDAAYDTEKEAYQEAAYNTEELGDFIIYQFEIQRA